jgi:hypothetical protein
VTARFIARHDTPTAQGEIDAELICPINVPAGLDGAGQLHAEESVRPGVIVRAAFSTCWSR